MKSKTRSLLQLVKTVAALLSAGLCSIASAAPPAQDREAILAMAGEYDVTFTFEETVSLQSGYELKKPYHEEAKELVIVVKNTPGEIALQHVLLAGGGRKIVKHWRQVWTWQDQEIVEYQGNQTWKVRRLSPDEVAGTWSQLVTQVDDSPRYESYAKWNHEGGYSRWESTVTARPLPRREHTKRSDYQILQAINRHAITPHGWVHEQDNLKLVLDEEGKEKHFIARERGLNTYFKATGVDFSAARSYWDKTNAYWSIVVSAWDEINSSAKTAFSIPEKKTGDTLMEEIFAWADTVEEGGDVPGKAEVIEVIKSHLEWEG